MQCAGSEDRSMKIWSFEGPCLQTISFAGCVWSVAFLPSGDALAATSDSKAYVFSSDEIRQGPSGMQAAFEAEVAAHAAENAPTKGTGTLCTELHESTIALTFAWVSPICQYAYLPSLCIKLCFQGVYLRTKSSHLVPSKCPVLKTMQA